MSDTADTLITALVRQMTMDGDLHGIMEEFISFITNRPNDMTVLELKNEEQLLELLEMFNHQYLAVLGNLTLVHKHLARYNADKAKLCPAEPIITETKQ